MKKLFSPEKRPILVTGIICIALYLVGGQMFDRFMTVRVFLNFFADNAFLGVIAIGLTLVILTGGIDLSVGSMAGCTSIMSAVLVSKAGVPSPAAFAIALAFGTIIGAGQGFLIARYQLAPFLVTLGGLFLCRGIALLISRSQVSISDPLVQFLSSPALTVGGGNLTWPTILFVLTAIVMAILLRQTRFGRTLFAIGGNANSAHLMGLSVEKSLVKVYALSGFFGAFGGILFAIYTASGNAIGGTGLELDAIAAVVIGGTLLTGGVGSILGTILGILTLAVIQTGITFHGDISSWWNKIVVGSLLLIFVLLQRALVGQQKRS